MSETVSSVFKVASDDDYYVTKSFSWEASWRDVLYDFGVFLGSLLAGMVVYMIIVRFLPSQLHILHLYES